jgi:hypothetical protein
MVATKMLAGQTGIDAAGGVRGGALMAWPVRGTVILLHR